MVTLETKRKDTRKHIASVRGYIGEIVFNLQRRSLAHDQSKLEEPEVDGFYEMAQELKLSDTTYGSDEYRAILKKYKASTIQHHYENNDHHPEHFERGWYAMNYLQKLELLADWKAATMRMKDGDLRESIFKNADRFGYDDRETSNLISTAQELGWLSV
jgi:hypothetical protein